MFDITVQCIIHTSPLFWAFFGDPSVIPNTARGFGWCFCCRSWGVPSACGTRVMRFFTGAAVGWSRPSDEDLSGCARRWYASRKGHAPVRFTQKTLRSQALLEMIGGWMKLTAEDSLHVLWDHAVAFLFMRSLDTGRQPLCANMAEFCSCRKKHSALHRKWFKRHGNNSLFTENEFEVPCLRKTHLLLFKLAMTTVRLLVSPFPPVCLLGPAPRWWLRLLRGLWCSQRRATEP